MLRVALAALAASVFSIPVLAEDYSFGSDIAAVTVFPSGADVTRHVAGRVDAGSHRILVKDLPAGIDPDTIRVTGQGAMSLGTVDVRTVYEETGMDQSERKRLMDAIDALQDESQRLERGIADIETQRMLLQTLMTDAMSGDGPAPSPETLGAMLDLASARLSGFADTTAASRQRMRAIASEIADLMAKVESTAPSIKAVTEVALNVDASSAGDVQLDITYPVMDAGWSAAYDADLVLGDKPEDSHFTMARRAVVRQDTTEAWTDVALTLSTARLTGATQAPDIGTLAVDVVEPAVSGRYLQGMVAEDKMAMAPQSEMAAPAMAPEADAAGKPIRQQQAEMQTNGFKARYLVAGPVTVGNSGEGKSVLLGVDDLDTDLRAVVVPAFDTTAYLVAPFALPAGQTYLPGPVLLRRDGNLIGRAAMPFLGAGEQHELGFGALDFISVAREQVDRNKGVTGIISSSRVDEARWLTTIQNNGPMAFPVVVRDRMPVSNNEDIEIAMVADADKPDVVNADDMRGVMEWHRALQPQESWRMTFGYSVRWPQDVQITPYE